MCIHKGNWEECIDFCKYLEYVSIEIENITNGLISRDIFVSFNMEAIIYFDIYIELCGYNKFQILYNVNNSSIKMFQA